MCIRDRPLATPVALGCDVGKISAGYLVCVSSSTCCFDCTDGMLSIRARNPPDRDIADVLRKFKVSFNLLVSSFIIVHNFLSVVMYIFSDGRDLSIVLCFCL